MAGHFHWSDVTRKKARVDNRRGELFATFSRAIIAVARHGAGDPDANLTVCCAINKAHKNSMPTDSVERVIKKSCGESSGKKFKELRYEGCGTDCVAVLCEVLTDTPNRTAGKFRKVFEVNGGNPGATGCVARMFDRRAVFRIGGQATDKESLFEAVLEADADDVVQNDDRFEITANFSMVNDALHEMMETAS